MQRKHLLLFTLALMMITVLGHAQKAPKKPSKIWYTPTKTETKEVKLEGQNIISEKEVTKFKLVITNKTKDFLILRPQESIFKSGGMTVVPTDKKKITIRPLDNESKVIDCANTQYQSMHEYNFSFIADGIYKSTNAKTTAIPDYKIPPSQNIIEEGDFKIELISSYIQADTQWRVKLKVTYNGEGLGIVESRKISARLHDGSIIANGNSEKIVGLEPGEDETIVLYFSNNRPITIVWNDAFKSAGLVKLEPVALDFVNDPTMK